MIIFEQFFTSSSGKELSAGVCEANYLDLYSLLSRYPDTFTLKRNGKDSFHIGISGSLSSEKKPPSINSKI